MGSSTARKALVIGGSMSGLFSALMLRQAGWTVEVFERVGSGLSGRGAGIVTHKELFEVMARAGLDEQAARVGVEVPGRRMFDRDGRILAERPLAQTFTSWGHLYGLLRRGLPDGCYRQGENLLGFEERRHSVVARFADGAEAEGDLLIGADGLFSTLRAQVLPDARPRYAGYVAWRGLVAERDLSGETRAALCDHFSFSLPPGEQMLGYPVAGVGEALARGERRYNFVWYRPAEDTRLADLLTDVAGVRRELSIPPQEIRKEVTASLRSDAERLLPPQFAEVVRNTEHPFIQAILDLETPRMALGARTVILGDAAFVARPHVGMGVTKAAGDADALARAIALEPDNVSLALSNFEQARLAFGRAVVRRARDLGAYMQAQILTPEERLRAEQHRQPDAVMAETAVATGIAA